MIPQTELANVSVLKQPTIKMHSLYTNLTHQTWRHPQFSKSKVSVLSSSPHSCTPFAKTKERTIFSTHAQWRLSHQLPNEFRRYDVQRCLKPGSQRTFTVKLVQSSVRTRHSTRHVKVAQRFLVLTFSCASCTCNFVVT